MPVPSTLHQPGGKQIAPSGCHAAHYQQSCQFPPRGQNSPGSCFPELRMQPVKWHKIRHRINAASCPAAAKLPVWYVVHVPMTALLQCTFLPGNSIAIPKPILCPSDSVAVTRVPNCGLLIFILRQRLRGKLRFIGQDNLAVPIFS